MHAFLIVGKPSAVKIEVDKLSQKLSAKTISFPISKIEDTRDLGSLIRLSLESPVLIVSENIDSSTPEALNAFLKNLEEPQENVYFALTTATIKKVLPTIASRCQIIHANSGSKPAEDTKEAEEFLQMAVGEKIAFIDKIKDRTQAIEFTKKLTEAIHKQIHSEKSDKDRLAKISQTVINAHQNLERNGNVALQLSNLVINLD